MQKFVTCSVHPFACSNLIFIFLHLLYPVGLTSPSAVDKFKLISSHSHSHLHNMNLSPHSPKYLRFRIQSSILCTFYYFNHTDTITSCCCACIHVNAVGSLHNAVTIIMKEVGFKGNHFIQRYSGNSLTRMLNAFERIISIESLRTSDYY
jgi:hypothetical protein